VLHKRPPHSETLVFGVLRTQFDYNRDGQFAISNFLTLKVTWNPDSGTLSAIGGLLVRQNHAHYEEMIRKNIINIVSLVFCIMHP
jgi:hypothetical protein